MTCPHCGYCPHCGRSNWPQFQPYYPYPQYPYYTVTTTAPNGTIWYSGGLNGNSSIGGISGLGQSNLGDDDSNLSGSIQ